jgi:serine/threonine protein kinase
MRPSLPCGNSPNTNAEPFKTATSNNYVTKYIDQSEALEEKKQAQILREALKYTDPDDIFISPQAICSVPPLSPQQQQNMVGCKAAIKTPYLVQLAYGGKNLSDFQCPPEDRGAFMESILNLLQRMKYLHDANICHLDIKPENIVTQRLDDASYLTRFVDIGYMMDTTRYAEYTKKPQLGINYSIWPYETRYLSIGVVVQPPFFDVNTFYNKIVAFLPAYGIPHGNYYDNVKSPALFNQTLINRLLQFCRNPNGTVNVAAVAKATDIYSLGWTLCVVYTKVFKHRIGKGNIEVPEVNAFHTALANRCTRLMYTLVCQMMWPDPTERLTIDGAIAKYTELLKEINSVLAEFPTA